MRSCDKMCTSMQVVPIARPVVTTCDNKAESEDTLVPRPSETEASASSSSSGGVDISEASAALEPSKCTCAVRRPLLGRCKAAITGEV